MFSLPSRFKFEQIIPISIDEAWDFFSRPKNLRLITPEYMDFTVQTPEIELEEMYPGQLISYTVKPLAGIPIKWTTEITHVKHGQYFVDEQRFGPYKLWHHQHHFEEHPDGVKMVDIVHYMLPLGPIGWAARKLFVSRQLTEIFNYRQKVINQLFSKKESILT